SNSPFRLPPEQQLPPGRCQQGRGGIGCDAPDAGHETGHAGHSAPVSRDEHSEREDRIYRVLQCRQRGLRLKAQEETMDIPCDTVTMATTQGFTAVACITYSTLDSIINKTFLSEGNLPAGEKRRNVQLNSRVVSGAIGDGRPLHLSRAVNLTLHQRE
ncbi:unnamed protein product, partial [Lepidochelys kempii]